MVCARRLISSLVRGSGTRRCIVVPLIDSTSRRIASTGCSARPTTSHATSATNATTNGNAVYSDPLSASMDSSTPSRGDATTTVNACPAAVSNVLDWTSNGIAVLRPPSGTEIFVVPSTTLPSTRIDVKGKGDPTP